jgi:ring-1,2-phenylacetyl-CoA epoxidase subunit PaaE
MRQFHPLTVVALTPESHDAVRIALDVPEDLRAEFTFLPGQHLPIEIVRAGKKLRRTYSICTPAGAWPLEIGVRIQPGGAFGEFAAHELAVGDTLDVMPPTGRFHLPEQPADDEFHVGFAAGSGITPVLSIIASLLEHSPRNRVALFYGNRKQNTTMFIEDLYALKNRFPERLQLHFVFSREEQEFDVAGGRLDADKVVELLKCFCSGVDIDGAWICGPDTMIDSVSEGLATAGIAAERIHAERFGAPKGPGKRAEPTSGEHVSVTVIMDGHEKAFEMPRSGVSIVDAAAEQGIELPFSCKGGVCATCRTHLRKGKVDMAVNYGLEPWEVEQGFVLACQATPQSGELVLDYDKT